MRSNSRFYQTLSSLALAMLLSLSGGTMSVAETNILTLEEQEQLRLLRSDLNLISQFGGIIEGVNAPRDAYEGFSKGFNVERSILAGRAIAGSYRSDLLLISQFGGIIEGVNGPRDKYQGFTFGYDVAKSLAAGRAIYTKPTSVIPPTVVVEKTPSKTPTEVVKPIQVFSGPVMIENKGTVYTEGSTITINVIVNSPKSTKGTLFFLEGKKTTVLETKEIAVDGSLSFITQVAIGSYFVLLNTGERSESVAFDVRSFGFVGIRILNSATPATITVPVGDLGPGWNVILVRDGRDYLFRAITKENRGEPIRFRLPAAEARYTVKAEFKYQVTDARTGEILNKTRVFEDPFGGAILTRNS
jgi:hypothetical protein